MRIVKIGGIVLVVYVLIVVIFESLIGYFQPEMPGNTLVLTTIDGDGDSTDRVLQTLDSNGQLYVAVNHWPRAWYRRALANPNLQVTRDGEKRDYLAVPISGEEHERVDGEYPRPLVFLLLTGFPPRSFLRLDEVGEDVRSESVPPAAKQ